jgi:hypothetical protein
MTCTTAVATIYEISHTAASLTEAFSAATAVATR